AAVPGLPQDPPPGAFGQRHAGASAHLQPGGRALEELRAHPGDSAGRLVGNQAVHPASFSFQGPLTNLPSKTVATTGRSESSSRLWGSGSSRSGRAMMARSADLPVLRLPAMFSARKAQAPKSVAIVSRSGPPSDGSRPWRKRISSRMPSVGLDA